MMDSINLKRKVYLEDVVVLRLSLIVLLVLYHSFCIFSGAWEVPKDYPLIPIPCPFCLGGRSRRVGS